MRKTKIICTLGPATEKAETVRQLIQKGADVFRFNMSHAEHGWVRAMVPRIRQLAGKIGRPIAILLDAQGPAIRTGDLKTDLDLKRGDILEFTVGGAMTSVLQPTGARTLVCESGKGKTRCPVDTSFGVQLARQLSKHSCAMGRDWG